MEILIKKLNQEAKLPVYSSEAAAGIDLFSMEDATVEPGSSAVIGTGVAIAVPIGYVGLIWSKNSIVIGNEIKVTSSLVDSGYRKEVKVELFNTGSESYSIAAGENIAQLLVQHIHKASLIEAEDLSVSGEE